MQTPEDYHLHVDNTAVKNAVVPITLTWKNIQLQVPLKEKMQKNATKTILQQQSGIAKSGQLLCIMGPSGAGKSSLLDVLSGRQAKYTGEIRMNGQLLSKEMNQHVSYIMQTDSFYPALTVMEHLLFQAKLRTNWAAHERKEQVLQVLDEMGLMKCRDTQIGDNYRIRGISGGERKRLSFATEVLTNPSLLFVDEPTSGLDSFMAESVVGQLQALARSGRTVIATIHQPSAEVYAMFDTLYLLSNGHPVYYGPAAQAKDYFASVGHVCPTYINPSDYFMREMMLCERHALETSEPNPLVEVWKSSTDAITCAEAPTPIQDRPVIHPMRIFSVLCHRNVVRLLRDKMAFRAKVAQNLFVSVIVGLIYWQLELSQTGIQSFTGVLFFMTINQFFGMAAPEFAAVALELPIMAREYQSGLYPAPIWYLAKNASELILQCVFPLCFVLPVYFMVGFPSTASVFFSFYAFLALLGSAATGIGYMVSCLVQRPEIAPVIGIMVILPFLIFGGLFINSDMVPVYFQWLEYISPIKYAFRGLSRAFWSSIISIPCATKPSCIALNGNAVLVNMSLNSGSMTGDMLLLLGINILFRALGGIALSLRLRRKQQ